MSKTNTENTIPEMQAPETAGGLPLDVRVRPIAPMGNLLAFANVTIGGCFKIDGFRICSGEKGLYVNMPSTQDKNGNWKDVCWPVTAEFRKQLNDALLDGYGQAIENLQATLEATKGAAEKPDCALIGQDGNIFNLVGIAARILREHDLKKQAQEMKDRVFASGSYSEALCIIGEYVNITDSEAEPERKLSLRQQLKETKPAEPARSQKQPKQPER